MAQFWIPPTPSGAAIEAMNVVHEMIEDEGRTGEPVGRSCAQVSPSETRWVPEHDARARVIAELGHEAWVEYTKYNRAMSFEKRRRLALGRRSPITAAHRGR
jgi:hypothetical protein